LGGVKTPIADTSFLAVLCHERLSIVGVGGSGSVYAETNSVPHIKAESGAQPLTDADESIVLAVNGEIYNHRLIRKSLKKPYHFKTTSDCEVVIPLVSWRLHLRKGCPH
jgi:asparagine synthase (glutamine-hydrolysing)